MSKIILKSLALKNFKGIKDLHIDFGKTTNISGENATGKTSIFDAFTWLLFDKDSQDRSKFNVQPLGENNNVIHMQDTEVTGAILIDGVETVLKKVLKEKWVKKRGEVEAELKGTETSYYINEVPCKQSEYQQKIASITGEENIFKLITNPLYFSLGLKWQDRRKIIFDINGDVDILDVINYNSSLSDLQKYLNSSEDIESFKKRVKAQIAKLKKDKESIPARVNELRGIIRNDIDFNTQENNRSKLLSSIKVAEEQILDSSKANVGILIKKNKFYDLKSKLNDMEYMLKTKAQEPLKELHDKLNTIETEIFTYRSKADRLSSQIDFSKKDIEKLVKDIQQLRNDWNTVNQESLVMSDNTFVCPTCLRPLDEKNIEAKKHEMEENFNQSKAQRLAGINSLGKGKKEDLEEIKEKLEQSTKDFELYNTKLNELNTTKAEIDKQILEFKPNLDFADNKEYQELKKQITDLEVEINTPSIANNQIQELRQKKTNFEIELEGINKLLSCKEQNETLKKRISELMEEEKKLAQQIADLEKQEYLVEEFTRTKVELLESSINTKFKFVKFKLFNSQVNGAIEECCEALVDGVPFSNANTASQINAGLDIINSLCSYYSVQAPIFIDNRESVNKIIDTNSQIINLTVSKDKKIKVEVM